MEHFNDCIVRIFEWVGFIQNGVCRLHMFWNVCNSVTPIMKNLLKNKKLDLKAWKIICVHYF